MNLKTTNQVAIENAIQVPKGKNLTLLGKSHLAPDDSPTLFDLFGTDHTFFYLAEKIVQNNTVLLRERGIGRLVPTDSGYELERIQPLGYYVVGDANAYPCLNGPIDFAENVIISNSYPHSFLESLSDDYSVVACDKQFIPKPVQLSDFSVLGRLDGDIVSLSFDELAQNEEFREALVRAITGYTKQMAFSATKINTKTKRGIISSNVFQLVPTNNPPTRKGTLIYDESDDTLKYYDGTSWRSLSFTKDNLSS
jgi:hypothetical protein